MSRQIGLKNIKVALLLTDTISGTTYAAPEALERAIKATLKPKSTQQKLYSDDSVEEVLNLFDSVDVSIELNQLSVESRALLQGSKVVKGVLVESKSDVPPVLALGFQSKKTNGKYRFVWLYKGSFSLSDDNFESETDKPKDQTSSLTATFYSRDFDGAYRLIADEDAAGMDPAFITAFFNTVATIPVGAAVTTVTIVAGMTAIVTTIVGTVITVATGKTVAQLKTALEVDGGNGTFKVYASSAKTQYALDVATVVNTMVVEAKAEDGTTKATYTIAIAV